MNQVRKIVISEKVFKIGDIQRIASIFDKQTKLAERSEHDADTEYSVVFSDGTTFQSDTPDLFSEESLIVPARPVAIRMSFRNYELGRHISLTLRHGDLSSDDIAIVSSNESEWLSKIYLNLKEALDSVQPQEAWPRKHKWLLLHLIALGVGTIFVLLVNFLATILLHSVDLSQVIKPLSPDSPWLKIFLSAAPMFVFLKWAWRWFVGFLLAAFEIRRWLLKMWPSVEFNFGLPHLQTERRRRLLLMTVLTLIIFPIIANLLYDLLKATR